MEHLNIRKAVVDDLETLFEFEQGVIAAERPFDPTLKPGVIHYYELREMIDADDVCLLVAELDGLVVGSGYARIETSKLFHRHPQHAYLGFMYVRPEFRGRGINSRIIEALKKWSLSKQVFELRLEVYYGNLPAMKAYEKIGFKNYMMQMRLGL